MKAKIKKNRILLVIAIILGVLSLLLIMYPTISNMIYQYNANTAAVKYSRSIATLSKEEKNKILSQAQAYNESLVGLPDNSLNYDDILNFDNGQICTIEIPKINVNLPVYHEDENALTKGAVHAKNSSFPIEGNNVNSVIQAHTGYPGKVFFDDLEDVENGDKVYIHILDITLTYTVVNKEVVKPENAGISIEPGNKLSLVTCYPYGVNSHRLIVTAEYTKTETGTATTDEANSINDTNQNKTVIMIICAAVTAILICVLIFVKRKISRPC